MAEQYGIHDLTENFTSPLEVMVADNVMTVVDGLSYLIYQIDGYTPADLAIAKEICHRVNEHAELAKDKARLDWLEHVGQRTICQWQTHLDIQGFRLKNVTTGFVTRFFATYREAIDAGIVEDVLIIESMKDYEWDKYPEERG